MEDPLWASIACDRRREVEIVREWWLGFNNSFPNYLCRIQRLNAFQSSNIYSNGAWLWQMDKGGPVVSLCWYILKDCLSTTQQWQKGMASISSPGFNFSLQKLLRMVSLKPSAITANLILRSTPKHSVCWVDWKEALRFLDVTNQQHGFFWTLLHRLLSWMGCKKKKETPERKSVHAHMIEMGNLSDKFLENALVNMYVKLESLATWQSFQSDAGARLCLLDSGNYSWRQTWECRGSIGTVVPHARGRIWTQ